MRRAELFARPRTELVASAHVRALVRRCACAARRSNASARLLRIDGGLSRASGEPANALCVTTYVGADCPRNKPFFVSAKARR
jgi:hypothetical protein